MAPLHAKFRQNWRGSENVFSGLVLALFILWTPGGQANNLDWTEILFKEVT
jgi:hypothetical protein